MNPVADRFIELATRPLADNAELQLIAEGELRQRLEQNAASPQAITEAADALARADQHPRRHRWRPALYLTTLLVSVAVLVHSAKRIRENLAPNHLPSSVGTPGPSDAALIPNITPSQKLLLLGDTAAANDADRWKALWNSNPSNPAYLAEYASAYFLEHRKLSPEILEASAKIDPDNGWFLTLSAAGAAEGAVTKGRRSAKEVKAGAAPPWKIGSTEKLDDTLDLIHQAAQKPIFTSYRIDLMRERIPLFAPHTDHASRLPMTAYIASQSCPSLRFRKLANAMAAGAHECAKRLDSEGFHQIVEDWETLSKHLTRNGYTLVDLTMARVFFSIPLENFRDAAHMLGLSKEADRFAILAARAKVERDTRDQRRSTTPGADLAMHRGSLFVAGIARYIASPTITDEDLKPGRYADHALFGRVASLAAWILFGIVAGSAALHRYRQSPLVRSLSARCLDLLRPGDWAWILIGGVLLPLIWFLVVTRLTPLSAREWSLVQLDFIQSIGQYGAMAASIVVSPLVLAAWRLGKRSHTLGLETPRSWIGWAAVGAAMLAVPAFGGIMWAGPHGDTVLILAYVLAGIPVLWLLVGFFRNILGKPTHTLRRATLARIALPAWICGMLVMIATLPLHDAEEQFWVQRDHLYDVTVEKPAPTRYEWEVTQALRKELLEMME